MCFAAAEKTFNSTVLNHHQEWIFAFRWHYMQDGCLHIEKQVTLSHLETRISKAADQINRSRRGFFKNTINLEHIIST